MNNRLGNKIRGDARWLLRLTAFDVFFSVLVLVAIAAGVGLWKLISPELLMFDNPFQRGVTDTKRIMLKFPEGFDKVYQADVPMNYLEEHEQVLNAQQVQSPIYLWTLYPNFEGYSPANAAKFHTRYLNDESPLVTFRIDNGVNPFTEDELEAMYGQKGVQGLLSIYRGLRLSKQQPYGNPIEYVGVDKVYIYDADDHAVKIECGGDELTQPSAICYAEKRWGNTRITIQYSFRIVLLRDFGRVEAGIDKLLNSFSIKEIPYEH